MIELIQEKGIISSELYFSTYYVLKKVYKSPINWQVSYYIGWLGHYVSAVMQTFYFWCCLLQQSPHM